MSDIDIDNQQQETTTTSQLVDLLCDNITTLLAHEPVSLAYLYGSAAADHMMPFSDVDIALVLYEALTPLRRLRLILRLQLELTDLTGFPNIDVRVINDAPLVFLGRVVSDGILLYSRDERERIEFESSTRLRYFDYLPVHREIQQAFFKDLKERGLHV